MRKAGRDVDSKRNSWKPFVAMLAFGLVIAQLVVIGFYNVRSDDDSSHEESIRPILPTGEATDLRSEGERVRFGTRSGSLNQKTDASPTPSRDTQSDQDARGEFSNDKLPEKLALQQQELQELIRLTSVEISHEPDSNDPQGGDTWATQGSGVTIAVTPEGFEVLTACHVVKGKKDLQVVAFRQIGSDWEQSEYHQVAILRCDEESDLAILFVTTSRPPESAVQKKKVVQIAKVQPEAAREVPDGGLDAWGLRWSDSGSPVPRQCTARARVSAKGANGVRAVGYWVVATPSVAGMSGGPLLNRDGCLIGIASGNSGGEAYYVDEFEIANLINGDSATKSSEKLE